MSLIQKFLINGLNIFSDFIHNKKLLEKCLKLVENDYIKIFISIDVENKIKQIDSKKKKQVLCLNKEKLKIKTITQDNSLYSQESNPFVLIEGDSSLPIEVNKITIKEFNECIDILFQINLFLRSEIYTITTSFLTLKSLSKLDLQTLNQYPYFFQIIINSLQTNFYTKLRRVFYNFNGSYDINSFIKNASLNMHIFSLEMLIKRKNFSDTSLSGGYSENCQTLALKSLKIYFERSNKENDKNLETSGAQLFFYIEKIAYQIKEKYENKFKNIANKVFSHLDHTITGNEKKLFVFLTEQDVYDIVAGLNYLKFLIDQLYMNGRLIGYFLDIEKTEYDFEEAIILWKKKWRDKINLHYLDQSIYGRYERFFLLEIKNCWYFYGRSNDGQILRVSVEEIMPDFFDELSKKDLKNLGKFEARNELLDLILLKLGYPVYGYENYPVDCEKEINQEINELVDNIKVNVETNTLKDCDEN